MNRKRVIWKKNNYWSSKVCLLCPFTLEVGGSDSQHNTQQKLRRAVGSFPKGPGVEAGDFLRLDLCSLASGCGAIYGCLTLPWAVIAGWETIKGFSTLCALWTLRKENI